MVTQEELNHLTDLLKSKQLTTETKYILLDKMYDRLFVENITYVTLITPDYIKNSIDAFDYLDDKAGLKEKIETHSERTIILEKEIEEALHNKYQSKYEDLIKRLDEHLAERVKLISRQEKETQIAHTTIIELNGIAGAISARYKKIQDENRSRLKYHKWIKRLLRLGLLVISLLIAIGVDRLSGDFKKFFNIQEDFHLLTIIVFFTLDVWVIDKIENFLTDIFNRNYFNARLAELNSQFKQFDEDFKNTCVATGMTEQQIYALVDRVLATLTN